MKIQAILGLILSVIYVVLVFRQLYSFKREFQGIDEEQVITEVAEKWAKRLRRLIGLIILMTFLGIIALLLPYLKL